MSQLVKAVMLAMSMLVANPEPEPEQSINAQKEEELYERGSEAIDDERWTAAIAAFRQIVNGGGKKVDRAMYWMGHAQYKSGRPADALATLSDLRARHPKSEWIDDAQALELEIRQSAGQEVAPESISDEELKLIAISSLITTDQERAVTLIEKILKSPKSSRATKQRALFVLGQSSSPRAQTLVESIARGADNPDLQDEAIQSLGVGGKRSALADIYRKSDKVEVKRAVLQALMVAQDHPRLLEVASGEQNVELRSEAVRHLGVMKQTDALNRLYATEKSPEVKDGIIQGLFIAGDVESLMRLARSEQNPRLRGAAIRGLGIVRGTTNLLMQLWNEGDVETKKAVIEALFIQGDAKTLVALARKETNRELRRELVQRISLMRTNEAQEFVRELLED